MSVDSGCVAVEGVGYGGLACASLGFVGGVEWSGTVVDFLLSVNAIGLLPKSVNEAYDGSGMKYYFQRVKWKNNVRGLVGPEVEPIKRACGYGKVHLVPVGALPRRHTPAMLAARAKFAAGVAAWHGLSAEEKASWNELPSTKRRRIEGFNAFLGNWMKS